MTDELAVIAIDGPSGAGKSTVARMLADELGVEYIDTGAMYRAVALFLFRMNVDLNDNSALCTALDAVDVDFRFGQTILNGEDVSDKIRTPQITEFASRSASLAPVREKLVALQRKMGNEKSLVLDGRDIGTNVFPNTKYKFFITASEEVRAKRRYDEIVANARAMKELPDFNSVLDAMINRDYEDMHRELNPLVRADDAFLIETDDMSAEQVTSLIVEAIGLK